MGQRKSDRIIRVKKIGQLQGTLRPATEVTYQLEDIFDPTFSITVPEGGLSFAGSSFDNSGFRCTSDNHTLFTGNFDGNVLFDDMVLVSTGTNSKIFDCTNTSGFSSVELNKVNLGDFDFANTTTSLGELTGFRQVLIDGSGFARLADGLTLSGTMRGGLAVTGSIGLFLPSGCTLFKAGTGLVMQGSSIANLNLSSATNDSSAQYTDFAETNIQNDLQFVLEGARFGSLTNPQPNLPASSTKVLYRNCVGIENTFVGAIWQLTTPTATSLTQGVLTKLAGATTYDQLVHFESGGDNATRYIASGTKDFVIEGSAVLTGGISFGGDSITLTVRQWDDSISAYVNLQTYTKSVPNAAGIDEQLDISYFAYATLEQNDRIELWATNNSDGTDTTLSTASFLKINPRT